MLSKIGLKIRAEADKVITMTEAELVAKFRGVFVLTKHGEIKFNGYITWKDEDGKKVFAEASGPFVLTRDELMVIGVKTTNYGVATA